MSNRVSLQQRVDALQPKRWHETVGGLGTSWWEYGPLHPGGDTIVAVHGFRGDHHGLEPFVAHWPDTHWIIPDLPGFGESEDTPGARAHLDDFVSWLQSLVERVRPATGRLIILGHSFGSIVVAATLAKGLDVDRAILVNPIAAPALAGPRGVLTRAAVAYYRIGSILPEQLGRAWLSHPLIVRFMGAAMAKHPDRDVRRFVHDQHLRYFSRFVSRDGVLAAFRTSVSHDVSESARNIAVPLLLVAAERDDITAVAEQERVAALTPRGKLVVIPRVGHLIHYETPAVAVEHMRAFLADA
ncbi:MAG TPA: alpha/beta fold hydrolase [Microbacteriaceae bacterium]|nr:alpha/beta fold hydrolase [Microbacteriaceae bacterium]